MRVFRYPTRRLPALALCLLAGCERARRAPATETAGASTAPLPTTTAGPATLGWVATAGPVLLVAGDTPDGGAMVFPDYPDSTLDDSARFDLAPYRSMVVDLFARSGAVGQATVHPTSAPAHESDCASWPLATLTTPAGSPPAWTVALEHGHATAIPLDSIDVLSPADSARLVAEVARIASTLPGDSSGTFRGLPFVVRSVRRFTAAPGVQALFADIRRKLNEEARPREEQILLVAERDSGSAAGPYRAAYFERTSGLEETIESTDVLAALALGTPPHAMLVLGRDYGDGTSYSLLERTGPRQWRIRWTSAYAGC